MIHGDYVDHPTYAFLETIVEGDSAVTLKCTHEIFGTEEVHKTISLMGLPDALANSEVGLLSKLRHPHLVEIREAQWTPEADPALKMLTFVMPYYAGGSMLDALNAGHVFSVHEGVQILRGLLEVLHYLHRHERIVHRDIKPANVFLDGDRATAYLGDLGEASRLDANSTAKVGAGTPLYRAPEVAAGVYTPASDIYSIGVLAIELFSGRFEYENFDFAKIDRRLCAGQRAIADRHFARLPAHVPAGLERIIKRMVAVDPDARGGSAAQILADLDRVAYINWVRRDRSNEMEGQWPALRPRGELRTTRRSISRGPEKGTVEFGIEFREVGSARWRRSSSMTWRIKPGDEASLRQAFTTALAVARKRWPAA